jgi:diguanylate cyclase
LQPRAVDGPVTLSIGVASRDASVADPETLLLMAEQALEAARHAGRNRVHCAPSPVDRAAGRAPESAQR